MDTKFTYYDIVGFIIPGAVVLIILYWFVTGFLALPPTIGVDIPESIKFLIFIVAGYFLGHVVHAIGAALLGDRNVMRRLYSEYFLGNQHYSAEYKNSLVQILNQAFTPKLNWVTEEVGKMLLFIIAARFLLRPRWSRYKEYYVDSIFTNLYVWYQTKQAANAPGPG